MVEKPEVRKAGGVYYTPEYIVRYIVENTVGKLIAGKTPAEIAPMKFADIACGSGSFLLGVYDLLLRHHTKYYVENPGKVKKGDCVKRDGTLHLSIQKKREILANNLYGVDIDRQAVEVAQLSLYLKLLEDETIGSTSEFQTEFHYTLLPSLDKNIVCGNSLIGPDILADGKLSSEEEKKLNPLDYAQRFPQIFRRKISSGELRETVPGELDHSMPGGMPLHGSYVSYKKKKGAKPVPCAAPETEYEGGFDAIVGNPPYVRQESLDATSKNYFSKKYTAGTPTADLYVYFYERGHLLLRAGGVFGFISSNKFMRAGYGEKLRSFLASRITLSEVIDFGELPVFDGASTFPAVVLTKNEKPKIGFTFCYAAIKTLKFDSLTNEVSRVRQDLGGSAITGKSWTLSNTGELKVIEKMRAIGIPLSNYLGTKIHWGIKTGLNKAFVIQNDARKKLVKKDATSASLIKRFAIGDDVRNYHITNSDTFLILVPNGFTRLNSGKAKDKWQWFCKKFPAVAEHLQQFEKDASKRDDQGEYWWELRPCDYYNEFESPKIVYPEIAKEPRFAFEDTGIYTNNKTFVIPCRDLFLLGLLNSKLIWSYLKRSCSVLGDADKGGRLELRTIFLEQLPIRPIDSSKPADKARHDKLVAFVEQMLKAKKDLAAAWTEADKDIYTNKCATLDSQIDALVYDLYGLTETEIKIVEGAGK